MYDNDDSINQWNLDIRGVSYVGEPRPHTVMYATKKVETLLGNLRNISNCLVFVEDGIHVPNEAEKNNHFVFNTNPQLEYAKYVERLADLKRKNEKKIAIRLSEDHYYISDSATVGENAYIEPNVFIGHNVVIGDNAVILAGAVIKNAIIGDNVVINENAVIGAHGFTMATDEDGNKIRIPTLGRVIIGKDVEIGAHDNISCGSAGDTIISDYAKLDALVHVGHDAFVGKNVEITAGGIIGGFARIEEDSFVGVNACLRNRITISARTTIGMGTVVTKSIVNTDNTVVGNPARVLIRNS